MAKFLQLIRFPNLVMIVLMQYLFKLYLINSYSSYSLDSLRFFCLVLATVCIAAGGNIINDIYDIQTDRINKPHKAFIDTYITKKNAFLLYFLFTFVGIGLGIYVSVISLPENTTIFIAIASLLFLYSKYLKKIALVGNIVVSLLVASSILILAFPIFPKNNLFRNDLIIRVLLIYAIFAFLINLIRELVKDNEDVNGDYNASMKTLSIVLGRNRVNKIVAILAGLMICFILYVISEYMQGKTVTTVYALLTLLLPLLYFIIKIWQADTKREYRMLSFLLKIIMFFGILSTLVFYYFDPIS
jgi:4-hydroxybenzoate polyprenyltransferase